MICPYCAEKFPLTWKRYWGSPLGKHRCPRCQRDSKFRWTPQYLLLSILASLIWYGISATLAVVAIMVFMLNFPQHGQALQSYGLYLFIAWLLGTMSTSVLAVAPFDRYYEEHYRRLEKLPTSQKDQGEDVDEYVEVEEVTES